MKITRKPMLIVGGGALAAALVVADFDRDGRVDIAVAEMSQGTDPDEVFLCPHRGRHVLDGWEDTWEKRVLSPAGLHSRRIVDVNRDGWPDLFGANWSASGQDEEVKLWLHSALSRQP